jgi:hypothetical protein
MMNLDGGGGGGGHGLVGVPQPTQETVTWFSGYYQYNAQ